MATFAAAAATPPSPSDDGTVCWICLEGEGLIKPCKCACMSAHKQCLAAWQLAKAGTRDEVQCRFCLSTLPAWQPVLRDRLEQVGPSSALPVVAVMYGGQEYRLVVQPTPEGLRRFRRQVETITGQPFSNAMDVRFFCQSPAGYNLQLSGVQSLEAAMTCAAVTAAERGLLEPSGIPATVAVKSTQHPTSAEDVTIELRLAGAGGPGGPGPAAMAAADAAGTAGDEEWDATATILHAGPARMMRPNDIVEYWRRQQLQRLQVETTSAVAVAAAAATAAGAGGGSGSTLSIRGQEAPVSSTGQPPRIGNRAYCLPMCWSNMLRWLVPSR